MEKYEKWEKLETFFYLIFRTTLWKRHFQGCFPTRQHMSNALRVSVRAIYVKLLLAPTQPISHVCLRTSTTLEVIYCSILRVPTVTPCQLTSFDKGGGIAFGGGLHLWKDANHHLINIFWWFFCKYFRFPWRRRWSHSELTAKRDVVQNPRE